jgi:hypothetical protein
VADTWYDEAAQACFPVVDRCAEVECTVEGAICDNDVYSRNSSTCVETGACVQQCLGNLYCGLPANKT